MAEKKQSYVVDAAGNIYDYSSGEMLKVDFDVDLEEDPPPASGGQKSNTGLGDVLKGLKKVKTNDTPAPTTESEVSLSAGPSSSGSLDVGYDLGSGLGEVADTGGSLDAGTAGSFDGSSSLGSGSWAGAVGGAITGVMTAYNRRKKYAAQGKEDPVMERAKEDGFGEYHKDNRDIAGGGTLGGVLGYFGGPVGAAVAGPVVEWAHPYGEKISRTMIKTGDKIGGAGGAMMLDPIGTVSSGKYKNKDLVGGALLGPAWGWFFQKDKK